LWALYKSRVYVYDYDYKKTDEPTDIRKQTERHRQTKVEQYRLINRQIHSITHRHADIQTRRQTYRETDRERDRQT